MATIDWAALGRELAEVEVLRREVKRRAMIFQCEERERAAAWDGLPAGAYEKLSYAHWELVRRAFHTSIELQGALHRETARFHGLPDDHYLGQRYCDWRDAFRDYLRWLGGSRRPRRPRRKP